MHSLHIVYDTPAIETEDGQEGEKGEVELVLRFDANSKRLLDAAVS